MRELRTRTQIEISAAPTNYADMNERLARLFAALLETQLDIRDLLLADGSSTVDGIGMRATYNKAVKDEEEATKKAESVEILTAAEGRAPFEHQGWTCEDAHYGISHEDWVLYVKEPQHDPHPDQAAEARADVEAETRANGDPYEYYSEESAQTPEGAETPYGDGPGA
jgi:hypothetical protein